MSARDEGWEKRDVAVPQPSSPIPHLRVGVVDVFVVSPSRRAWHVLALQRAPTVTRPRAWEAVHGSIEPGEKPHEAAIREMREETGLTPDRLYNVTAHAFYLHTRGTVEIAVVFCAFVTGKPHVAIGAEHTKAVWLPRAEAVKRFVWPSARENLARAYALLKRGHAGAVEDVLRVV